MRRSFGERLKQKRKEMRLSQSKLGKMVGVHYNHIGRYERGDAWPSTPVLIQLSKVLGIGLDALVFGEAAEKTESAAPPSRIQTLAEEAGALSAADQLVVVTLLEAFLLKLKIAEMTHR